ncbi:outer membrane protein assembly factor [Caulobacter endophyticus]|uniref:Translocation and assembly module subunit TamA n=1 Tax=Caulobacter endophyticus TaxID=2172652 RepID=A0A2T9JS60_9CAUL|nr:autotransporter assembly complex family protein [Caulobacter endophyticus]PVM86451.1 outer membrane protein assembly factor [Caulobacter endophyticus]
MVRKTTVLGLAAAIAAVAAQAQADEPSATITGVEDRALREAIQRVLSQSDGPPASRSEARRRARDAADDAVAVLRAEGYYAYVVDPDVTETDPPRGTVKVTPGQLFVIADPRIDWSGEPPDEGVRERAFSVLGLTEGAAGRAAEILGAEGRAVAQVQKLGYADAMADPRQVIVDHADHTVRPTFVIAAGDLVKVDGVELSTKGRTRIEWLHRLAPWKEGDVYDPEDIAELERRLRDTGVYDTVSVALAPKDKALPSGLRPIQVTLADRASRTLELGAGYSTSEGPGVDAKWIRYNRLRRADTTTITTRIAKLEKSLEGSVALPHWGRPQQTLKLTSRVFADTTDAYDETGATLSADLTRRLQTTRYRTYGLSVDLSQTKELTTANGLPVGQRLNLATFTALGAYAWDYSDNILDPRRGWRVEARAEPTAITGETSLVYIRTQAQGSAYIPFGKEADTVLAGRLKVGAMLGGTMPEVPASRRFYSGGGGSVRGYSYQAIGPRLADNTPQGGLSLVEASLELRRKFTQQWGGVVFIDAGAVGTQPTPNAQDFSVGAGFGVRYDLGFGPIRADIAFPLEKRKGDSAFQIYLSIGQSF